MRKALVFPVLGLLVIGLGIYGYYYLATLGPRSRTRVVKALQDRFDADVELKSLDISLLPHPSVVGQGLSIRHRSWNDPNALIHIRRFSAEVSFFTLLFQRNHIDAVRLEGLQIHLPPRGQSPSRNVNRKPNNDTNRFRYVINTLIADGTVLEVASRQPGKEPLRFDIQKLTLYSVNSGHGLKFKARLLNPKPPGLIETDGSFGPWRRDAPRSTPVAGTYTFSHADLGTFSGIRGTLSSRGQFAGILEKIKVSGRTDTPDFSLKRGGDPVHLVTTFDSLVDGANGDTFLNSIDARFARSEFLCSGGVEHKPGTGGKTVSLYARTKHARMEDILRLVIGSRKTELAGDVDFRAKILIPQGRADILDKLNLDGQFALRQAIFTRPKVQEKLRTLSLRARGISSKEEKSLRGGQTIASDLRGAFKLDNGLASFSRLSFSIPGATISLAGKYSLRSERIDMNGLFRMDSTLSGTQSGIKHLLLMPLDPFFRKDGAGFEVPIEIMGSRDNPSVDVTVFHRRISIH